MFLVRRRILLILLSLKQMLFRNTESVRNDVWVYTECHRVNSLPEPCVFVSRKGYHFEDANDFIPTRLDFLFGLF